MRYAKVVFVGIAAMVFISSTALTALAGNPYSVNIHLNAHKALEFDPNWLFEARPCFVAVGDLSEVFNAEAHGLAAGIDDDGNFVEPMHIHENVEESILFEPYDPSVPTYTGHATVHTTNTETSPNAGFTNTVILFGSDGSSLVFHQTFHILVKADGITMVVDHVHAQC